MNRADNAIPKYVRLSFCRNRFRKGFHLGIRKANIIGMVMRTAKRRSNRKPTQIALASSPDEPVIPVIKLNIKMNLRVKNMAVSFIIRPKINFNRRE